MLRLEPSQISDGIRALLKEIDRLRMTRTMDVEIPADMLERWQQEYAKNAAFHSARLDGYMRSIGRE